MDECKKINKDIDSRLTAIEMEIQLLRKENHDRGEEQIKIIHGLMETVNKAVK